MGMTDTVIVGVISAFIGAASSIATSSLTYFNSSRELDIRMVNVALTILSAKEKGTDTEQARRYALRALEHYGGVDIPDSEFEQWAKTGTVPAGSWGTDDKLKDALEQIGKQIREQKVDKDSSDKLSTMMMMMMMGMGRGNSEPDAQ